jgi:enoyl-CoA hydratase/carnithine racemase
VEYRDIIFEKIEGVAWVTINRPRVLNAFRERTLDELIHAIGSVNSDPEVGVVVITGAGDESFSSGGDFNSMLKLNRQNGHLWNNRMIGLATTIRGVGSR